MFRTFELFTVFGIPVRVHSSLIWFLVLAGLFWGVGRGVGAFARP